MPGHLFFTIPAFRDRLRPHTPDVRAPLDRDRRQHPRRLQLTAPPRSAPARGPRAGQRVLTVQGVMPRQTEFKQTLCADINGFSLHAAVRCAAEDRDALEQLCRYITRPALANERVQINAAGQVVLKLKTAWPASPRIW